MKLSNPLTREKFYRVMIYSKDVVSGTRHDGVFAVDMPDFIPDVNNYHVAVENFTFWGDVANGTNGGAGRVVIPELSMTQPDSYSTSSKTSSRVLCVVSRGSATSVPLTFAQTITAKTYGIPLTDASLLRTKQVRLTMKRGDDLVHDDTTAGASAGWVMTLVIYQFHPE